MRTSSQSIESPIPEQLPGTEAVETLRLERRLRPAQKERRARLRDAARELASEGGYLAVTIRAVAARAGVGPATVYRYFSSKDHLIAEVHAANSLQAIGELRSAALPAGGPAERLEAVFDHMLLQIVADPHLAAAGVAAITSGDPAANAPEYWQQMVMTPYLEIALGDAEVGDRSALAEIFGHLFFSLMTAMSVGRMHIDEARGILGRAIRRMLPVD